MKFVISLLVLPLTLLLVPASHAQPLVTTVTIGGQVNVDGVTVTVRAHATGSTSSLVGAGTDSPPFPGVSGNPGACQFPLAGSVSGSTVTLSGAVTQSSIPSFVTTPVGITASASTGAITFTFGPFTLTGTGTVVITDE